MSHKMQSGLRFNFNVNNITDTIDKRLGEQHPGFMGRWWSAPGPQYSLAASYSF